MSRPVTLITGATSGIGRAAAAELARRGHHLILACRNLEKAARIQAELGTDGTGQPVEIVRLDLASLASVRAAAVEVQATHQTLDVLINNAGTFSMKRQETEDGFELTFGVNHLGPFLLTALLLPLLARAEAARIVNVASAAARFGRLRWDDLQMRRRYGGFRAYAASRLATVLFTQELARRLAGTGITANCCHPGHVQSNIWPDAGGLYGLAMRISSRFRISAEEGAVPVVRLADDPELTGVSGAYFDRMARQDLPARLTDRDAAVQLWKESAELVGLGSESGAGFVQE